MVTFKRFKNGLYITEANINDPSRARVGFMFQLPTPANPTTFELSQESWNDPSNRAYIAFFEPSSTRDWDSFAFKVRGLFDATPQSQFGWFAESGSNVAAVTLILVDAQNTGNQFVGSDFSLQFNNVTLSLEVDLSEEKSTIQFDDASNAFKILNPNKDAIQLIVQPPNQPQQTYKSTSQDLLLPMNDPTDPNAGSANADFQFNTQDLANFEAGFMYFGPGEAGLLTALRYPLLRALGGSSAPINFSAFLDVLQPLVDTRSYLQIKDSQVGSYFADSLGRAFALGTSNGGNIQQTSRLAFANRPIKQATDTGTYYLTPAGLFRLGIDSSSGASAADVKEADLLCGVTGTEFLSASVSESGDSLYLETGHAAYRVTGSSNGAPVFLDSEHGNVTTSWVQFLTTAGSYVSQPQQSPLYQQASEQAATLSGAAPSSGLRVYLLDFLPLPTWKPPASSPLVPMVSYSGLLPATDLDPYLVMESEALNPTRKNAFTDAQSATATAQPEAGLSDDGLTFAMTPQGLLAGLNASQLWTATQIATSPLTSTEDVILQFTEMGTQIRQAMQQNQIFIPIGRLAKDGQPLFQFSGPDQTVVIAGWPFSLSPEGTPSSDGTPPIVILKFYPGQSIASLVKDTKFWSRPDVFFGPGFTAQQAQTYLEGLIQDACEQVYGKGNCPGGVPSGQPDTNSLYYNFYQVVTDPDFSGLLAVNCNMQLNNLPSAIKAVTGGMTKTVNGETVSNINAFRVHHVGVAINDTDPASNQPTLAQSSLFGLVDYEKPSNGGASANGVDVFYNFEVEFLRALFLNAELRSFSCKINLTINNLFATDVTLENGNGGDDSNVVAITGAYQAHSTSGDDDSSGQGVYSFVAEGNFDFKFGSNPYLDTITLTKLQFTFDQETPTSDPTTSRIEAGFGIWGKMVFKQLNVLDIFSFKQLSFADLGIGVSFDLTIPQPPQSPSTSNLGLTFSPGNLRLDLADSPPRAGSQSLLKLLPFKLKSFIYSQKADQTVESLKYFSLSEVPGQSALVDTFNYGLLFDLDLGSMGALVGSLAAFKFGFLIGWKSGQQGGIAFGVQLPEANGKLEIKIQGVLNLVIEEFLLKYVSSSGNGTSMLVLALHNSYLELLGTRLPPNQGEKKGVFDFLLFAPTEGAEKIGWIAAVNYQEGANGGTLSGGQIVPLAGTDGGDDGEVFELVYLGGGQRVGPPSDDTPTNFQDFLDYMTGDFWKAVKSGDYDKVYHPEGDAWLVLSDFKLLGTIEVGFIFYDFTPFYSLNLITPIFNFEITYTKISDSIGLFYANFTLPDDLRTFQVGAASLTMPAIDVSVYTNGNWKLDVGFPQGDDWSRSFQVQAQAGPVPVTGAGGFYIASLSSATSSIFKGDYPSIVAFGFAARLGVGKDFTSGPFKAGVSVTFFGIIEGAAGYLVASSDSIFQKPDALSLQGQFGVIGELYGKVDFKIIQASVNVTLSASIGIQLLMEGSSGGEILLYIQASVQVSVKVKIKLALFSVSISFKFSASFRFQWELGGSSSAAQLRLAFAAIPLAAASTLPLCSGLNKDVPLWFLPEATVIFPASTGTGTPWFIGSLGIPYDDNPPAQPSYAQFKPFEAVTTQLVTWAVGHALNQSGCSFTVTLDQMMGLDQNPDILVGWLDYPSLISQLAVFSAAVTVPSLPDGDEAYATTFPMPPFLQLQTDGRLNNSGQPDDLNYQFSSKNQVPESYIEEVDQYFNQLFVNQTDSGQAAIEATEETVPLIQEVFLNFFAGLIRGGVHQLLETMQNDQTSESAIDKLIEETVGAGLFKSLAGQMSSSFRGGARLPYTSGLTVPGGPTQTTTNPLYALLWQEFPVGKLSPISSENGGPTSEYKISITNPDASQAWITADVDWALTNEWLDPYAAVEASQIVAPSQPSQLPFTNVGPQSFAFENPTEWTQPGNVKASLRPFPSNLQRLQSVETGNISVVVQSRQGGAPYLPGGTPLLPGSFVWATAIQLSIKQEPAATGGQPLKDIYSLNGASQRDQALLEQILRELESADPIAGIQVLYQESKGATGLNSGTVKPSDVFVLRTNTTTVSAPPAGPNLMFVAAAEPPDVAVGAQIDEHKAFLQIIQQAAVTNAPGYYLRYLDTSGNSLPTELFSSGPAPLTILITFKRDGSQNTSSSPAQVRPYYNSIVLSEVQAGLIYYADTTDPALDTQYSAVAAGSVGVGLTRSENPLPIEPSAALTAACGATGADGLDSAQLLSALVKAGVTDPSQVNALLAESGSAASQLNDLYSLITYQVEKSEGFIQSNLSAPIQPQQPDDPAGTGNGENSYRVFVPLYNLAEANQPLPTYPNRYASIDKAFSIDFFQNDSFGNQMPAALDFGTTNYYFDPIVPLDQWQGVVPAYDFSTDPTADSFVVHLTPSPSAFNRMTSDQASAALEHYETIYDQITGPGVSFYIETNFALQQDGTMVSVTLDEDQQAAVVNMVGGILDYLKSFTTPPPTFDVKPVALAVTVTGPGKLPPVFEMAVLFGIERDVNLISPLLKNQSGNVTFPSAQNVSSSVPSGVGAAGQAGVAVPITAFAQNFVKAFPALVLSVGLNGARSPQESSKTGLAAKRLKSTGMPGDGSGTSQPSPQSLWAVQKVLLDVNIGVGSGSGPFYLSPKPLDNALNTQVVPLPSLPPDLEPSNWPKEQLFTDVDEDAINRPFFKAVDDFLSPSSAAAAFEDARDAYDTVAYGRKSLAQQYSLHEVDWLFSSQAPFTGTSQQLADAQEAFEQQMRAALMTAYSVDTLVQYSVNWNSALPQDVGDLYELFGQVEPTSGELPKGLSLSSAHVPVRSSGPSLLTFLFGVADVADVASVTLDLEYNITHVQHFLEPASQVPEGEARPSLWLQLVEPYPSAPDLGSGSTEIPLVFRQYPTPPTVISQTGSGGASSSPEDPGDGNNPLTAAAAWHCIYQYQAQFTAHDRLNNTITYNTDLRASHGGSGAQAQALADGTQLFSLFEALARFSATYPVLQPALADPKNPNFAAAAETFASLVNEVKANTTWNPVGDALTAGRLENITDSYVVKDEVKEEDPNLSRLISMSWEAAQGESSFSGVGLSIEALAPNGKPYPDQTSGTIENGITDLYTPQPPLVEDWVIHQVEVDSLNVLAAENALVGVQTERNLIEMTAGNTVWAAKNEFVYKTPIVRATQPVTPFVDNNTPIDISTLPNQGISQGCPSAPPPPGLPSLCQRIYTMLYDLLADPDVASSLAAAQQIAGQDESAQRRVRLACSFQYPIAAAVGGSSGPNPISPVFPVVLARSFLIDGTQTDELNELSALLAQDIAAWAFDNQVAFGADSQPADARFVFDITLYAQLAGLNTPVLRLRNLQLKLTDIEAS